MKVDCDYITAEVVRWIFAVIFVLLVAFFFLTILSPDCTCKNTFPAEDRATLGSDPSAAGTSPPRERVEKPGGETADDVSPPRRFSNACRRSPMPVGRESPMAIGRE